MIYDKDRRKLFEQGRQRFRMEAQRLALFRKESAIITVYHTFEENDTAYLVMEYVEGDTIESLVKRDGVMSAQQVREIMIPLLTVLNKVHEKGIIHRDIARITFTSQKMERSNCWTLARRTVFLPLPWEPLRASR